MNEETVFLTKQGYRLMHEELEQDKKRLYEEIPDKLKAAKLNGGNLRENKEYMYLQSQQQYYEREVHRLTSVLERAEIIADEDISPEKISVGSSFILQDLGKMESGTFTLVSTAEVDLERGKISVDSPVGKALVGHREGEEISVELSSGLRRFRIIAINQAQE
jgi:transcription elongation factor GreA